ncbi:MAG TPA: hypothetical protein VMW72_26850 [Sedimentisphaerales bacterium]|nr:hypothetical protein [Sedimentisphaerales bacterium]
MNKRLLSSMIISVTLCVVPNLAFGWGAATHAFLAKELGHEPGVMNLQEMYGAVVPDMFNLMFGYEHQDYLWTETHYQFMKVVNEAKSDESMAFAYGFASHNEDWGADLTAHISSVTVNPEEGYVVTKMKILAPQLRLGIMLFLNANGIAYTPELLDELALVISDSAIESAIDLLVSQDEDTQIGMRMQVAAKLRSPFVPMLLSRAYAKEFAGEAGTIVEEAILMIVETEETFKEYMELYGEILTQENAVDLMAEQGAQLAELMLEERYGIIVEVPSELMKTGLLAAIDVVKNDYSEELAATLVFVEEQLESHGVESQFLADLE